MMKSRSIGILDSGVGGLSVLKEIHQQLPNRDLIYVGDSAWCPYGNKPGEQIRERVGLIVDYLMDQKVELIVIACNSATIHAVEWLRSVYPIPFVGMEPGVKPACAQTQTGVVGVLATEASIAGEKFLKLVDNIAGGVNVITQPCPLFVKFVESGKLTGDEVDRAVLKYTDPLLKKDADVLVLGCTHYPFLTKAIRSNIPQSISLIDTGYPVACRVIELLEDSGKTLVKTKPEILINTTGAADQLIEIIPCLLPTVEYSEVRHLELG